MTDTITLPRSVVEQALEAWEQARGALAYVAVGNAPSNPNLARSTCSQAVWVLDNAEPALRAALEQPQVEQEPVAWMVVEWSGTGMRHLTFDEPPTTPSVRDEVVKPVWTPLYTHPQTPRQPLTDEEILKLGWAVTPYANQMEILAIARAVERAHEIGGEA